MKSEQQPIPVEPFPPREFIQDELEARGWTYSDLARRSGLSREDATAIAEGEISVTPEIAAALEKAFGISAQTWMNLQASYDRWIAAVRKKINEKLSRRNEKLRIRKG